MVTGSGPHCDQGRFEPSIPFWERCERAWNHDGPVIMGYYHSTHGTFFMVMDKSGGTLRHGSLLEREIHYLASLWYDRMEEDMYCD